MQLLKNCILVQLHQTLLLLLQVIRALMIAIFYPILRFTGYSITWQKAVVMVWSGLRGAVGLALSLFVLFDTSITDIHFRVLVFFMVSMEAAISIVVQGSSMGLLLQVGLTRLRVEGLGSTDFRMCC